MAATALVQVHRLQNQAAVLALLIARYSLQHRL
jgi:hypothetical protein